MKSAFLERLVPIIEKLDNPKILDLGSGRSEAIIPILKRFPKLRYVGIEPIAKDVASAKENLKGFANVQIIHGSAVTFDLQEKDFDIVLSLSVLEHVKYLEAFLRMSVLHAKQGGLILHRYDLGHALHPGSLKERLQVYIGNTFPYMLPESKFVRYVDPELVIKILKESGARLERVTYHQMPNHKKLLKYLVDNTKATAERIQEIIDWEFNVSQNLEGVPQKIREELFPAIAIWAYKV